MVIPNVTLKPAFVNILKASHLTKIDNNKLTAIHDKLSCSNYSPFFDGFSILTKERNDFKLKMMEPNNCT